MQPSTGLPALDGALEGLRAGDNVVWKVASIEDYAALAEPFWQAALRRGERVVYFRFAEHRELVPADCGADTIRLRPEAGFERFITRIHQVIAETNRATNYVFDMFSDLVRDWYSERMLGNLFLLTCPYLYARGTVSYFAVLRNYHSYLAIEPITDTTQLLIEVYRWEGDLYLHPLKVDQRYSPTMHLYWQWKGDDFVPITDSAAIAAVATSGNWPGLRSASYRMVGMWDRRFIHAEEVLDSHRRGEVTQEAVDLAFESLLTQLLSCDERILQLVRRYLTLEDLIYIWKRVVGSGLVGGKATGMLLARAILRQSDTRWADVLEPHDSFFIGSDIFYVFLVQNGCWWIRQKQKNPAGFLDGIGEVRHRILQGEFPAPILERFGDMLDYFGQCPIIVRSSSLLEDAFGNAFAGQYESVFCVNRGTRQQRLAEFLRAVRVIYASAMSEDALLYRAKRGVLERDEQMALLVQRVSGTQYGELFYPQLAGVGISVNPYVWHPEIDPEAGLLRVVFGLGTRAVERTDDDYTRIVALNVPHKRPEGNQDEVLHHSQRRVDYLDLQRNRAASGYFNEVAGESPGLPVQYFAEQHRQRTGRARDQRAVWTINLDRAFSKAPLLEDMREMLSILREAYGSEVDIEFTANLQADGTYKINLLQCRPLQIQAATGPAHPAPEVDAEDVVLRASGAVLGHSRRLTLDRLIYVVPSAYGRLPTQKRYAVAQLIGKLTHLSEQHSEQHSEPVIMLLGPGRWGTQMPELGVPTSFREINTVSVLCEIDAMHEDLSADLSLGTHFFHEAVEMNLLYLGFFQGREQNLLNAELLSRLPNRLADLLPGQSDWCEVVHVIEAPVGQRLLLSANQAEQKAVLYLGAS